MGGGAAKKANSIAKASLNEQKRQYAEQEAEKKRKKEEAMANASGSRLSSNMAYSNNYSQATDFTTNQAGQGYNILTAGGTDSVIGSLLGTSDTLGG